MKVGFIVPVVADYDINKCYDNIKSACSESKVDFEIVFAFNGKLTEMFSKVRNTFMDKKEVKAFKVDQNVNEHKLITLGMEMCEKYSATIVYSAKEEINKDVINAFIASWRAGNKIVYLKKLFYGPKKIWSGIKEVFYRFGIKIINCFKDYYAETDIQLLDQDVVKTINKLPAKNRMLRTCDAFIGYNYDIIRMEVDSKLKVSKYYEDKTKQYKLFAILSIVFGVLFIADFVMTILATALGWRVGIVWIVVMLVGLVVLFLGWIVTFTRRVMSLRIGSPQNEHEFSLLKDKMERYNY